LPPANETMCNRSPMWADIGDMEGTDATCNVDTDGNDPAHRDCGDTSTRGPSFIQNGSTGVGVWAKSAFSLSPFAGRIARLRWIGMEGGGWSFGISRSFLEPATGGIAYQYFDGDDGWYIDDIKLTDLREAASTIGPDTVTGLTTCVTGNNIANCGTVTPTITGSSALALPTDPSGRRLPSGSGTLVPGQLINLDARASAASGPECLNGVLLFQWDEINSATGAVIDTVQSFSPQGKITVAPGQDTTYRVSIKCSSDTACAATRDVLVATRDVVAPDDIVLTVVHPTAGFVGGTSCPAGTSALLTWPSVNQSIYQAGYDVYKRTLIGISAGGVGNPRVVGDATGAPVELVFSNSSCFDDNVPQVLPAGTPMSAAPSDSACPTPGQAFLYQVGHRKAVATPALVTLPIGVTSPCPQPASSPNLASVCSVAYKPQTACP